MEITIFVEKTFMGIPCAANGRHARPQISQRKLSRIATIYGHTFNKYSPEWSSYFHILLMVTNELHWFLLNLLVKSHLFRWIFDISKSMTSWLKIALHMNYCNLAFMILRYLVLAQQIWNWCSLHFLSGALMSVRHIVCNLYLKDLEPEWTNLVITTTDSGWFSQ